MIVINIEFLCNFPATTRKSINYDFGEKYISRWMRYKYPPEFELVNLYL